VKKEFFVACVKRQNGSYSFGDLPCRLSRTKSEYMRYIFSTTRHEEKEEVSLDGLRRTHFDI
jgi:hypothetical protein